jgi:hypothetical protein
MPDGKNSPSEVSVMKTIVRLIFCSLLLAGWGLAALSLHVVRTSDQIPITLVPKEELGITDTYVDTRKWTLDDIAQHPLVVQKLINSGKADVLKHVVSNPKQDVASQLTDELQRAPKTTDRAPTTAQQATSALSKWF